MEVEDKDQETFLSVKDEYVSTLEQIKIGEHNVKILEIEDNQFKGIGNLDTSLEKFKKVSGVWAILGKETEKNDKWIWLQVAKTNDIAWEIKRDIERLNTKLEEKIIILKKDYYNRFNQKMFRYTDYLCTSSKEYLYHEIASKYKYLKFILVGLAEDDYTRTGIEVYFAWKTRALYWRNGRSFKKDYKFSEEDILIEQKKQLNKISSQIKKDIDIFFEK